MRHPRFSVVIPTRDRAEFLARTLAAFAHQTVPKRDFEVRVVDNGSEDGTGRVVRELARKGLFDLRSLRERQAGAAAARNRGIRASRGRLLVFLDDTCMPHPDLLLEYGRGHRELPGRALIGRAQGVLSCWSQAVLKPSKTRARAPLPLPRGERQIWLFSVEDALKGFPRMRFFPSRWYGDGARRAGRAKLGWRHFVTANVSIARELLERNGGFNEGFRGWGMEDVELGYRLAGAGVRFSSRPAALCYHQQHPMDFAAARKSFRRNIELFCRLHPGMEAFRRAETARVGRFLRP